MSIFYDLETFDIFSTTGIYFHYFPFQKKIIFNVGEGDTWLSMLHLMKGEGVEIWKDLRSKVNSYLGLFFRRYSSVFRSVLYSTGLYRFFCTTYFEYGLSWAKICIHLYFLSCAFQKWF